MYRYKYDKSYHHKSRRARRTTIMAAFFSILVLGAAGYIAYDVAQQMFQPEAPVSRTNHSSVQGDSINVFSTVYFQFQADDSWKEITSEEKDGHYVYRSYKDTLVVRDIMIDVNKKTPEPTALVRTSHVYPVTVDPAGRLLRQGGAGEHCKTLLPKNTPLVPLVVKQKQVSFVCTPDANLYQAVVGVIGGDTSVVMPRPNGSKATYKITYRDLTITPVEAPLNSIIESFQTR